MYICLLWGDFECFCLIAHFFQQLFLFINGWTMMEELCNFLSKVYTISRCSFFHRIFVFHSSQFILVQSTAMSNVCLHQRSPTYLYRAVIIQIRCFLTDTHLTFQIFSWLCAFYQCECVRAYLNNLSLASERDRTRSHKINTMDSLTHSHWIFIYTIQRRICV